jgi:hypothetical protein
MADRFDNLLKAPVADFVEHHRQQNGRGKAENETGNRNRESIL